MKLFFLGLVSLFIYSCSSNSNESANTENTEQAESMVEEPEVASDQGIGKFKDVVLSETIDPALVAKGAAITDVKCASCHKMTDEKLVGPGWKGVTKRRTPAWILNFITNVDEMLTKDPEAQAQLEICLVRMPNQNLSDDDAKHILEFMRDNDNK